MGRYEFPQQTPLTSEQTFDLKDYAVRQGWNSVPSSFTIEPAEGVDGIHTFFCPTEYSRELWVKAIENETERLRNSQGQ